MSGGLVQAARDRVRLRTRLRRARQLWQHRFPPDLPAWDPRPGDVDPDRDPPCRRYRPAPGPRAPVGRLAVRDGTAWEVTREVDGTTVVAGRVGQPLDRRQLAVLAALRAVTCPAARPEVGAWAEVVRQLATTGVPVYAPDLPGLALPGLAPELAGLLAAPLPGPDADPLAWELRGVRQRRAALRGQLPRLPAVSAVLVTCRPQQVVQAVAALVAQSYPALEIVVGLHGGRRPPGLGRLPVVTVPAGQPLGEVLAAATQLASGELVTKVDDDDHYGPEHVWDLVLARHQTGATVTGKAAELVHLAPKQLTVRRRMACETWADPVAGGALLVGRDDLAGLGGWPAVPRSVDRALLDRVLGAGGEIYRTHPFGFVYTRQASGHTWPAELAYFQRDLVGRWRGLPARLLEVA